MGRLVQASNRLAVVRCVVAGWAIPALAAAGPAPRATVRVDVDLSKIEEFDAGGIEREVRARTEVIVDQQGYFLDDAATDSIVVRIEYVDKEDLEYGIYFDVIDDGMPVEPSEDWIVCMYCNHRMVAERYAERLPSALDRLAKANAAAEDPAPGAVDEGTAGQADEAAPDPGVEGGDSEPKPADTLVLRNAGLGLLIPGALVLGAGLGMVVAGTREVDRERPYEILERNFRPPGIGLAAVGGAATAVGIGLLVTHAVRKRGKGRTTDPLSWGPMLDGRAGLVVSGRF